MLPARFPRRWPRGAKPEAWKSVNTTIDGKLFDFRPLDFAPLAVLDPRLRENDGGEPAPHPARVLMAGLVPATRL